MRGFLVRSGRMGFGVLWGLGSEPHHPTSRCALVPPSSERTGSLWFTRLVVSSGRPPTPDPRPLTPDS